MQRNTSPQDLGFSTVSRSIFWFCLCIRVGLNLHLQYDLPTSWGTGDDNVIAEGQVIELPKETYVHELHLLYAGDGTDG